MEKCKHCKGKYIKKHPSQKFCKIKCKDRFHNKHNPRGYGLRDREAEKKSDHEAGLDAMESGWGGHKNAW